jgi:tetratricopeptide (TPR) repeat protein
MFAELLNNQSQHTIVRELRLILAPYWLGRIADKQKKPQEAEQYFANCLDGLGSKTLLPLHPGISAGNIHYHRALCIFNTGKLEECTKMMQKILNDVLQPNLDGELLVLGRWLLGRCLYFTKKYDDACELLKLTVTSYESKYGYDNLNTSFARVYLADSLCELQRYAEAEPFLMNAATQQVASPGTPEALIKAIGGYWLGRFSFNRGQLKEAESHFNTTRTLLAATRAKDCDHIRLDCRHFLARIQLRNKQYAEADNLFRELAKQQYESGHLNHAVDNQYWLGFSLYIQNKFSSVRPVLQRILDDNKEGRLIEHVIPSCQFLIGYCLFATGKSKEAKSHFEIALEYPLEFPMKYRTRYFLGRSNYRLTLYEEARKNFQSLVEGHSDPEFVFNSRYWLGKTHFELQNWDDASIHLQIAHGSIKKEWQNALESQFFLGRAHFAVTKYEQALGHFQSICDTEKDKPSATVLDSYYYLGLTLFELCRFEQSKKVLLLVLLKQRKQTPLKQLDIMSTRYQLARCLVKLGICAKAQGQFEDVLPFFESRSAGGDQTVVHIQYELACISYRHKNWKRALDFFQEALLNHEIVHVNSSLDVLQCQHYLAATLRELQKYDESLLLYQQVLENRKETLQAPHQSLIDVQTELCKTLCVLGRFTEALQLTREALEWQEELSGSEHLSCLPIRLTLANLAYNLADYHLAKELYFKALARLESSDQARNAVPSSHTLYYAILALALWKLGQADEAKEQAVKALKLDYFDGYGYCKNLDGFMDVFGELQLQSATSSCHISEQLPSSADEKPTNSVMQHPRTDDQLQQPRAVEHGPSLAENASQTAGQRESSESPVHETRNTPFPVAPGVKKPPPIPKRKPTHLSLKS